MNEKRKPRSGTVTHTVRTADGRFKELKLTRKIAMAVWCSECLGWEHDPVDCTSHLCPLWPWRSGTRITRKGNLDKPIPVGDPDAGQEGDSTPPSRANEKGGLA